MFKVRAAIGIEACVKVALDRTPLLRQLMTYVTTVHSEFVLLLGY